MDTKRYALIRDGSTEHRIEPGQTLSIGRHDQNDIVIERTMVSRFHATLRWDDQRPQPYICDNGSQNGTSLNGHELNGTLSPLTHNSIIELGGRRLKVELFSPKNHAILEDTTDAVSLFTEDGPELIGAFKSGQDLRKVLQLLEVERRTGTLHIELEKKTPGQVVFCLGQVMVVQMGDAKRTRALEKILMLEEAGRYRFSTDLEPTGSPMNLWFSDYLRHRTAKEASPTRGFLPPKHKARGRWGWAG